MLAARSVVVVSDSG